MDLKSVIAIVAIAAVPLCAHAQLRGDPDTPMPTKADAERVVWIVSSDENKTKGFCEIATLDEQIEEAAKRKDMKKVKELSDRITELRQKIGPEFVQLMDGMEQLDLRTKDGQEVSAALEPLDRRCAKKNGAPGHGR